MIKFRIAAASLVTALALTLTPVRAQAHALSPKIVFAGAEASTAGAESSENQQSAMGPVEYESDEKSEWFDAMEGFFSIASLFDTAASASPAEEPAEEPVVDSEEEDDGIRSLFIDNVTFVSLRDLVTICSPDARFTYDGRKATAACESHYMEFTSGAIYFYVDGRILPLTAPCFEQDGCFYVPLRALAQVFSYDVSWDEEAFTATLSENGVKLLSGEEFYNYNDYILLAKLIKAESGNQPLEGKIAVGNVIMNRVKSSSFPNNIYDVIYDRSCGIQFTTAYNGALNNKPTEECLVAAKLCLEGYSVTDDSLFFFNPGSGSSWIQRNRTFVTRIGDHVFYS